MENYEIKQLSDEDFFSMWRKHSREMFKEEQIFRFVEFMPSDEKEDLQKLKKNMGKLINVNFCAYHRGKLVGWSWGYQESAEAFYMCNSAVFPEHRRKGLYSLLLEKMIKEVSSLGFQRIYSRHNLTNNSVLIPKLKAGFVITTMEVSDIFGSLVHLTYYKNKIRNKMLDYRVGMIKPDKEIKTLLKFD